MQDLDCFIDETSALVTKQALLEMYRIATREPHSFLYVDLLAHRVEDMFFICFSHKPDSTHTLRGGLKIKRKNKNRKEK